MASRFGNKFAPQPTSTSGPRRVRRRLKKKKEEEKSLLDLLLAKPKATKLGESAYADTMIKDEKTRKAEEKEKILQRLQIERDRKRAAQMAAVQSRRAQTAAAVPEVLQQQSNNPDVVPTAAQPQTDPRLQQNAMLQASMAQGDPSMNPNAQWGEQLPAVSEIAAQTSAPPSENSALPTSGAPGVDALVQQQAPAAAPSPTDQLNQFSKDYLGKVSMRKKIMQSLTAAFGGTSMAEDWEKEALVKYTNYVNNQAAKIALAGGHADATSFMSAVLEAGGDTATALAFGDAVEFGGNEEYKPSTFSDGSGGQYSGYVVETKGEPPQRFYRTESGVKQVPPGWVTLSSAQFTKKPEPSSTLLTSKLFTPESRGRYRKSGNIQDLQEVETGSGDPLGGYKDLGEVRKVEKEFRTEYTKLADDFGKITDSYSRVLEGTKLETGPGDIAIVFNYMKMLDPASVVRESEYATAKNAGGVEKSVRNYWNQVRSGDVLHADVRAEILEATERLFRQKDASQQRMMGQYIKLAQGADVNPEQIIIKHAPRVVENGVTYILVGTYKIPEDNVPLDMD
tara:strand:- start:2752 stop:4449 length:1698 start_codon:yes stop_codon:yes gene_type:complete